MCLFALYYLYAILSKIKNTCFTVYWFFPYQEFYNIAIVVGLTEYFDLVS